MVKGKYYCILNSDKKKNISILKQEMQASALLLLIICYKKFYSEKSNGINRHY